MVTPLKQQRGVVYLWMLFLVFLLSLGLGKTLEVYSTSVQREKEAELLYVGTLYRNAIKQFYLSSPGSVKKYPASLSDLLKDPRSLTTRRYLRQLYPDPLTGTAFVEVMAPQGGIWGVRSTLDKKPLKEAGFDDIYFAFTHADSYQKWQFVYAGGM
ncbi:MAG: hypothetical protein PSX71_03670 [bacterium]|nr:hypothetical protein [bacterium]